VVTDFKRGIALGQEAKEYGRSTRVFYALTRTRAGTMRQDCLQLNLLLDMAGTVERLLRFRATLTGKG
jgi:hypothetical protein